MNRTERRAGQRPLRLLAPPDEKPRVSWQFWVGMGWAFVIQAVAVVVGLGLYALLRALFEAVP